jgi:hypothetical protein
MTKEKQIQNNEDNEISFSDILLHIKTFFIIIKKKWHLIFFAGLFSATILLVTFWNEKPIYTAELSFAMEEEKAGSGGLGGALGLASSFGIDIGGGAGGAFSSTNLSELMKSRLILEKVLLKPISIYGQKTSLIEYYIKINHFEDKWLNNDNLGKVKFHAGEDINQFSFLKDSIFKIFYKELTSKGKLEIIQKDKKITIISVIVKNKDEIFAKLFCENLAKEVSNFYVESKSKKARINVEVLQKQVDSVKTELNFSIKNLAKEIDYVYNLNPALNSSGIASKKRQIDVQTNSEILKNLIIQLELAKISLRKETPLIQLIDVPKLPLDFNKFGKLKSFLLGLIFGVLVSTIYLIFKELNRDQKFNKEI